MKAEGDGGGQEVAKRRARRRVTGRVRVAITWAITRAIKGDRMGAASVRGQGV